jgi:hypothetical protein
MDMFDEIEQNLKERMKGQINSMCATDDEVRLCWLVAEVEKLRGIITEWKNFAKSIVSQ